jgi:hypothetical protein
MEVTMSASITTTNRPGKTGNWPDPENCHINMV